MLITFLALNSCGAGNDDYFYVTYSGKVSGVNCFDGSPISKAVRYRLFVCDTAPGSYVDALDQDENYWQGSMIEAGAFEMIFPGADDRYLVRGNSTVNESTLFTVTDSCVSFRCCTTLFGELTREEISSKGNP
jgi:hypothetical protein